MAQPNIAILDLLKALDAALKSRGKSSFRIDDKGVTLFAAGCELAKITPSDITVLGKSFQGTLQSAHPTSPIDTKEFTNFFAALSPNLVRLNHLGISYFAPDLESETRAILALAHASGARFYEEPSSLPDQRWLFAGDAQEWQEPLFEFVLTRGPARTDLWRPHLQVDLDTALSKEEIIKLTDQCFGEDFVRWELSIPNHGTVLLMGILGSSERTKIALGIGTSLRNTEEHRRNDLKEMR